ncbi:single-strand binding protein [Limosilactobacillus frumenti DSM 13145]|uniref:Single-stranded DNA-binding protein n=1 Tax=Limosilactobacillus frumenti DSM 13145 TaxID=1423746 RepID=A0A0R1P5G0_9LACO|nr:single-stranded DNA-binding protein [Limosilactobacillus frumenti]KRL27838.1 single-strand binding protein [Limosilactobacillus frumenti DSM 13145]MBA2914289.1 single-stranded DNA-binding protein [Limosilactobacillus frumenti]QFG71868.1 single-stranded DNA-binding protein [Limosilactobacillus frumenti]
MLNRAVLTGRLTRDPELRYTTSGTAVVSFTLAVDRQFRNQNGDRDADFINCVIWRKSAENFSNFTHKGSLVGIEGRIQTRNYENQQGNRVYVTEVVVDNFALLEPRQGGNNQGGQQYGGNQQSFGGQGQQPQFNNQPQSGNNAPQANSSANQGGFGGNNNNQGQANNNPFPPDSGDDGGQSIDLSDDELPF